MKRVAVITDVVNPRFFFPIWHKYYSNHFGAKNIFVLCYANTTEGLDDFEIGGQLRLDLEYNNEIRARFISSFVDTLLCLYDAVIRVDADEFLLVDARLGLSVGDYINSSSLPYITAFGLDLIQNSVEPALDTSKAILGSQRRFAYPNCSLNKTCMISTSTRWVGGFHYCNHYPYFDKLYILHLRLADINQQMQWSETMKRASPVDTHVNNRYSITIESLRKYRDDVFARPLKIGWEGMYRRRYMELFFEAIEVKTKDKDVMYVGAHFHDDILIELPREWHGQI